MVAVLRAAADAGAATRAAADATAGGPDRAAECRWAAVFPGPGADWPALTPGDATVLSAAALPD